MDSEETLKYLQQKYPEDLNENYRCYWWCTSNIDGSALTYYQVIESAPDLYNNMKMLLKIHTKPSVLYKDFLARPLVNKINKNKNQEIV